MVKRAAPLYIVVAYSCSGEHLKRPGSDNNSLRRARKLSLSRCCSMGQIPGGGAAGSIVLTARKGRVVPGGEHAEG